MKAKYACGCSIATQPVDGRVPVTLEVLPCAEHGNFAIVQRALRLMREALEEAHEQLPPGPKQDEVAA